MDKPSLIGMMLVAAFVSALTTIGYNAYASADSNGGAKLAVVDVTGIVDRVMEQSELDVSSEDTVKVIKDVSNRMVGDGFVVVDQRAVLAAPEGYQVNTDRVLEMLKKRLEKSDN